MHNACCSVCGANEDHVRTDGMDVDVRLSVMGNAYMTDRGNGKTKTLLEFVVVFAPRLNIGFQSCEDACFLALNIHVCRRSTLYDYRLSYTPRHRASEPTLSSVRIQNPSRWCQTQRRKIGG